MDPLALLLVGLASAAGILVVTLTTVVCAVRLACARREREIFRAYVEYPHTVEAWLVRGALEQLRQTLALPAARS